WRFHLVHHADLDLDASTALRFHFGELLFSVAWRAAQVLALGVSPRSLSTWQSLLFVSILFHHSNARLPIGVERRLNLILVTPRMHGIHHSTVREERDANWSSGLTLWDRLHGTLRLNVPQAEIEIGVPAYRAPEELGLVALLKLPFGAERPARQLRLEARTKSDTLPAAANHLSP
ncbi:MAG TPA: sterol desaturase family protein, partial [Pyrinomonadaceae bacterium]|nr:sterol desaturase family protein [Pyrinomonadaceae bacterium]